MSSQVTFQGWAATKVKEPLEQFQYQPRPMQDLDIDVQISHCGICHSDLHYIDNGWGGSSYPSIPGHEIIGTVTAVGPAVKGFKIGDRVGVGPQCLACYNCDTCKRGEETMCKQRRFTYNDKDYQGHITHGGYASGIRVDSRFAFHIPENLPSDKAAPLLCAGLTVYVPFVHYGVKKGDKVAVVSIGGLGHLALQFANAMGFDVTCISSSKDKEQEARQLGAHNFVHSKDPEQMKKVHDTFNFILVCASGNLDFGELLDLLTPDGKLCVVGIPEEPVSFKLGQVVFWRKAIVGSIVGDTQMTRDMLKLCSEKNIVSWVTTVPMSSVNETLLRVRKGEARYRFVLQN